ncbi:MAG: L7Ae/L30e/S12e/Gadd45 family ribosomal protein [Lachnospirales bacterium]
MSNIYFLLGICRKAGLLCNGESLVQKAISSNKAQLVIIAEDASDNTKKKFINKSSFYNIKCIEYSTKEKLGRAIGKEYAASIAILDKGLGEKIESLI